MDEIVVQDLLRDDLLEDDVSNETVDVLSFIRDNDVALSADQVRALIILREMGMVDICNFIINSKRMLTLGEKYRKTLDKLTLADRIKGNAKLSQILRSNPNPAVALQKDDVK